MHDRVHYDPIQGQSHEPFNVGNLAVFKSYLLRRLQWDLATDHGFLIYGTISKFHRAGFLIFNLVMVSRAFEVGTNVSCEESTISPSMGLIVIIIIWLISRLQNKRKRFNMKWLFLQNIFLLNRAKTLYNVSYALMSYVMGRAPGLA